MSKVEYIRKDANKKNRILLNSAKDSIKINKYSLPSNIKSEIYRNNDSLIDEDEFENNVFNSRLITEEILKEEKNKKTWSIREGSVKEGSLREGSIISSSSRRREKEQYEKNNNYEKEFYDIKNKMDLVKRENIDLKEDITTLTKTNNELKKNIKELSRDFEDYKREKNIIDEELQEDIKKRLENDFERKLNKKSEKYREAEKILKESIKSNSKKEKALKDKIEELENKLKSENTKVTSYTKELETKILNLTNTLKQNSDVDSQLRNERAFSKNEIDRLSRQFNFQLETLEKNKNKEINDNRIIYNNSISNLTEQNSKLSLKLKKIEDENKIELLSLTQKHDRTVNEKDKTIELLKSTFNTNVERIHRDINSQIATISNDYEAKIKSLNLSHENSLKEKEQNLVCMFQNLINKLESDKEKQILELNERIKQEIKINEDMKTSISEEFKEVKSSNIELINKIHILGLENDNYKREIENINLANKETIRKLNAEYDNILKEKEDKIKSISKDFELQNKINNDNNLKLTEKISISASECNFKDSKIKELNEVISEYKLKERELNESIKVISFNERELKSELKTLKERFNISESESKKIKDILSLHETSLSEKARIISIKDVEINKLLTENKNINEKIMYLQRELNNALFLNSSLTSEKDILSESIKEQKEVNLKLSKNNNVMKETITRLEDSCKKYELDNQKIKKYESIISTLETSNTNLVKLNDITSTRNNDLEKTVKDLTNKLEKVEKLIPELNAKNKEFELTINKVSKDKISEDINNNSLITKLNENIENLNKHNSELLKISGDYKILLKTSELKDDNIKTLTLENTFIKDKLTKSESAVKDLESKLSTIRKESNKNASMLEDYTNQIYSLKLEIDRNLNTYEINMKDIIKRTEKEKETLSRDFNEKLEKINTELQSRITENFKLDESLKSKEREYNEIKIKLKNIEKINIEINNKLEKSNSEISTVNNLRELIKEKEKECLENMTKIKSLEKINSDKTIKINSSIDELMKLKENILQKDRQYNDILLNFKSIEIKLNSLIDEKEILTAELNKSTEKLNEYKVKNNEQLQENKIKDEIIQKIESSIKSINSSSISEIELLNLRKEKDDLIISTKKLEAENKYKTQLYDKIYNNFTELNKKYDDISGKYTLAITDKQNLETRLKVANNENIHLLSQVTDLKRINENLNTQSIISTKLHSNNIKDIEKDTNDRIIESNKSLEYRYKVQIHKLSDIIKARTNELKFADDKYAKIMSEKFTEYTFKIQSLSDEIIKKDNEIKELLVKHEKDIKDTIINTESMFRTKMKLDPPTNYLRILKGKDHRIYVLQATLKSFRKDFQKKIVLLRNEISRLNKEMVNGERIGDILQDSN